MSSPRCSRTKRRASAALAFVALLALVPVAAAAPPEPLGHAGRWITDARGRVVVLHGFNTVPVNERTLPRDIGMDADDARWLARNGFNTIRLGLFYARVEPAPGRLDDSYLDDYARVQGELAREGVFTLLDMHQDQLAPRYGLGGPLPSRGFPEWFLEDDGLPNPATDYPLGYYSNPALNRAYDNLWRNAQASDGLSLQAHFVRGWRRVVRRFRSRPGVLGYDLFNEPWAGSAAPSCLGAAGCPPAGFDQTLLTAFTRRIVGAVRRTDRSHLIFYEPSLQFGYGVPTRVGDPGDPRSGFSFHGYCVSAFLGGGAPSSDSCRAEEARPMDNAEAHVRRTGDALLLSEAGFDLNAAKRVTELADRRMLSWQWWDYYGGATDFVRPALPALIRPYPQVVAGTPQRWSFDLQAKRFELVYSTRRARGEGARAAATAPGERFPPGSRTTVFVPELQFPDGYRVTVDGAQVVSRPDARRLILASRAGVKQVRVSVTGRPAPPGDPTGPSGRRPR